MNFKTPIFAIIGLTTSLTFSYSALANNTDGTVNEAFGFFSNDGWETITAEDGIADGMGGQQYDAEYLFYKYSAGTGTDKGQLSIGLQTGFDIWDGELGSIYTGDIALSFNNEVSSGTYESDGNYEYAIDFGLKTKDKLGHNVDADVINNSDGIDTAGLYSVSTWNNTITHPDANPFAMDDGVLLEAFGPATQYDDFYDSNGNWQNGVIANPVIPDENGTIDDISRGRGWSDYNNDKGTVDNSVYDSSYFRVVTFDLNNITGLSSNFTVDAHWTMSCGNDHINGNFEIAGNTPPHGIPEPSILALFTIGSLSMGFMGYRRRKITAEGVMIA